jgi:hypothetical protein
VNKALACLDITFEKNLPITASTYEGTAGHIIIIIIYVRRKKMKLTSTTCYANVQML